MAKASDYLHLLSGSSRTAFRTVWTLQLPRGKWRPDTFEAASANVSSSISSLVLYMMPAGSSTISRVVQFGLSNLQYL
jgi:hypothetical protein